ncbi:ATP-binding protein [Nonomuraea basaltis]|uniref:ATP-binding protein n=1 Tax=Nonomuraea basaltis TaxID=2495887 RepID=UPI00110C5275|nr:ATP-binding protein [Nonomuraea basaltis]TMR95097.1 hypothetical protein EJK15_30245 [Nonomuraea basaltis]
MELRLDGRRGLAQVLLDFLARWEERTGIAVAVWAVPGVDVPRRVSEVVLATVREAFDNVERHGRARTVSIALTVGSRGLRLTISDDGAGFAPGAAGRGQIVMKAGLAGIGGTLKINSVVGGGTTVSAAVPSAAMDRSARGEERLL